MNAESLCNVTEKSLVELILRAKTRLVFVAPGATESVAEAISKTWRRLGVEQITIILDVDAEVCRLGYGTLGGLKLLQKVASEVGGLVCHQPGVRICVVLCDNETVVFSPTPLLIEAGSSRSDQPNGIHLSTAPKELTRDLGLTGEEPTRVIGLDPVKPESVAKVAENLETNPPLKYDIARQVRVFNAALEFVEFEMHGCFVSRKTATIPPDLLGLAQDEATKRRLRSSFKLLDEKDIVGDQQLSEETIKAARKRIADTYLRPLKGFGTFMLRSNKQEFLADVERLKKLVGDFQAKLKAKLEQLMKESSTRLADALFASVKAHRPERWKAFLGQNPSDAALKEQLLREIRASFDAAGDIVGGMSVETVFKGVTYETLVDVKFQELVSKQFPGLAVMDEFQAARQTKPPAQQAATERKA